MVTLELFLKNQSGTIQQIERMRASSESYAKAQFNKALLNQIERPLELVSRATTASDLMSIMPESNSHAVKEAYYNVYKTVGAKFAKETYRNVKAIAQKADDAQLVSNWQREMERFLDVFGAVKIVQVGAVTDKRVKAIINREVKAGVANGASIEDIKKTIQKQVKGMAASRARTIARTEVVGASNQGSLVGAQSSGLNLDKRWITARNKIPPRQSHQEANGQTVGLYERFTVGGEKMTGPGDVSASAENVINCRCSVIYLKKQ